ncbi:uroporphyrinogen-III C-methyltransferase [Limisphaera ngatamarikiensis]|uniref:uroporphyrinogen-III C-methyltransferase n=1 Tax=Limisphaera ngatamarikiensis TaxID=1324935 RepID=A0A6M1RK48_9BACT|nr:uroporphyrinogen-III C-methyltransferase [Limisphaera ngatamarikiensis]NGO37847.1 uroporphyrinogen-III C-methyltransferase [Limisphaera ngatamarikiensis]
MSATGTVYIVGAGPGDPGLLTLRAAELLQRADVVVYDALVQPAILDLVRPGAERIFGGRRAGETSSDRTAVLELLVQRAREGKTVVRLKGGDPYVFGRGGEEALHLAEAGVPFEVVPGVSSFVAVPAYAGVPVTHRGYASRLVILTGHADPESPDCPVDWAAEARLPGTKVILMGTAQIGRIAEILIRHGMAPDTPVLVTQWGTTARQRSVTGTLATIGADLARAGLSAPSVAVIGEVVRLRDKLNWYERRPLFGQRIVVTRARDQAAALSRPLAELGAEVWEVPVIKTAPPRRRRDVVDALLELNSYDWLVFTSPNGVNAFFDFFFQRFQDLRDLGGARIAAVGPGTAERLRQLHLQVDVVPQEALAVKVAEAMANYMSLENLRICLLRAEVANPDLPRALEEHGAIVDDIAVYRTVAETEEGNEAAQRLREEGADWITFTSGSTVEHFHRRFDLPKLLARFPGLRLASIGPETSRALAALGLNPTVEAHEHTIPGLVAAIRDRVLAERMVEPI